MSEDTLRLKGESQRFLSRPRIAFVEKWKAMPLKAGSTPTSESPSSSVVWVVRRLLNLGYGFHAQVQKLSADLPLAFTEMKSKFSPVFSDLRFLKNIDKETAKLSKSSFLSKLFDCSQHAGTDFTSVWLKTWLCRSGTA